MRCFRASRISPRGFKSITENSCSWPAIRTQHPSIGRSWGAGFQLNYEKARIEEGRRHVEDLRRKYYDAKEALERRKPKLAVCGKKVREVEERLKKNIRNCQMSEAFLKERNFVDEEVMEEGAGDTDTLVRLLKSCKSCVLSGPI